ncbi:hypothetical protein NQ315_006932 [Exocentrus adspersus]|uniref:Nucleoporin Nup159/Nup146 N-terminal domain-containing protein n=1 Tax=Exocentrus adspersus TaxID=1586481 RepID=A0AAV8WC37_9CUCU|nr:hypothetical protein NQ315_006932 [Exocentrus adspersus]
MFIASSSTTVKFHEFPNGNVTHHYQPGSKVEGPIRSISWSKDGAWLALVPSNGFTEVVSVKDQLRLIKTIQDIDQPSCAAFLNGANKLVGLGTRGGQVLVYDVKTRNIKKRFPRTSGLISHVDFTAKDTHCVAGCANGDILLYSNVSNNLSCTFRVPKSKSVTSLKANQTKRNLIMAGSNEGVIVVWDSNVNKAKFTMEAHKAPVTSVAFSPVNSDLVISTGADRQFCFYDIIDNKCIASVQVENNITSVDFSPEGTYFVMGSQNGRVYIYDSRNIQEPVHSFPAHSTAVKHLAFQRCSETSSSSSSMLSESVPTPSSEGSSNRNTSDLFGMFIQVPSNEMIESMKTSGNSMEAGDSFIAALGLDNKTAESLRQDEGVDTPEETKKWFEAVDSPANPSLQEKKGLGDGKHAHSSSTPKFFPASFKNVMSPILNAKPGQTNLAVSEIQAAAKEAVKEELKGTLEEIRADIKFQSTHITYQMRRMLLDLQMAMVREFIKMENFYNAMRDEILAESPRPVESNNYLLEENEQLRKRVEFLEQQIAAMTVSDAQPGQST